MTTEARGYASSIGVRLTLLYTVVVLVAMALFAIAVMWQLSTTFHAEHRRFLQAKVAEMQTDLNDGNGRPQALLDEIDKETAESDVREYQARVIASDGRMLGETPDMGETLPASGFPPVMPIMKIGKRTTRQHVFALTTVSLQASGAPTPLRVQIALDVTRDETLLSELRHAMWLAFGLLTPLLIVAGYVVSKHGLAPVKRIVGAARDVTPEHLSARIPTQPPWPRELGELVLVFNTMLTRLEEAFARLSRFSADLAHELRTPLGNMSGALEVCLLRDRSEDDYREALTSNLEECRRLNGLVDNLLFMARAEHAQAGLRVETFDGVDACSWVIAQQAPGAQAQGIAVELAGTARITADPILFRQALTNVLANAIQHSKTKNVRIELDSVEDGGSEVRVIDHGKGISAAHQPHLFDRFYRANPARQRGDGEGTGLGLSIVKTIVELHGGTAEVSSRPGMGTTVILRFPDHTQERAS